MTEKRIVPCRYFFKEGYCVKGRYCVFSHDAQEHDNRSNSVVTKREEEGGQKQERERGEKSGGNHSREGKKEAKIVCKFFMREAGCARGRHCTFLHPQRKPSSSSSSVPPSSSLPTSPPPPLSSSSHLQEAVQPKPRNNPADIWNFQNYNYHNNNTSIFNDNANNDGEYFYGAVTSNSHLSDGVTSDVVPMKKFTDLFSKKEASSSTHSDIASTHPTPPNTNVCPFYVAGNCRFGKFCRDAHVLPGESGQNTGDDDTNNNRNIGTSDVLLQEEVQAAKEAECGICLEPIGSKTTSVGNLGMLNNCSCTFCLECIRNWRANLVKSTTNPNDMIPKSTPHFRLCPLCRRESFFIVPCMRLIRDPERKHQVVEEYKKSLSQINCKNYFEKGHCIFGSSCFYRHISPSGEVEQTTAPRVVVSCAEGSVEYNNPTMLASFISISSTKK